MLQLCYNTCFPLSRVSSTSQLCGQRMCLLFLSLSLSLSLSLPHVTIIACVKLRRNVGFSLRTFVALRAITRARLGLVIFSHRIITCLSLQLTWVFHDDEAQINKKLPKELLLRYDDGFTDVTDIYVSRLNTLRVCVNLI